MRRRLVIAALGLGILSGRADHATGTPDPGKHFQAGLAAHPRSITAREKRLATLFAAQDFAAAETVSRQLLELSPANFVGLISLGGAQRQLGKLRLADRTLTRALKYYPSNARLLTELGLVKRQTGHLAEARSLFNQARLLDPFTTDTAYWALLERSLFTDLATRTGPDRAAGAGIGYDRAHAFDARFYASTIGYQGSAFKRVGQVAGLSGVHTFRRKHRLDFAVEHLTIDRDVLADLRQWDFTAAYTWRGFDYLELRGGGHYIDSTHDGTDGGWSVFGGFRQMVPGRWEAGVDLAHTRYANYGPSLGVFQFSPTLGKVVWQSSTASLRLDLGGHYVQPDHKAGLALRHYASGEGTLTFRWREWTTQAFGWAGKQAFALRGGGYTSFNTPQEQRFGYGGEIRKALGPKTSLSLRYTREEWRELAGNAAASNAVLGTLGISF